MAATKVVRLFRGACLAVIGVGVAIATSCSSGAVVPPLPLRKPNPELDARCGELTRKECMASAECSLILEDEPVWKTRYVCVGARSRCEDGIVQSRWDAERLCAQRPGCRYDPGNCYCHCLTGKEVETDCKPEGDTLPSECACVCVCGGGPPPNCVAG